MAILSSAAMLFLIMGPPGNLPVFLSVLKSTPEERRQRIIIRELLAALVVMLILVFAGIHILSFLHVRQEAVSISGGIILFLTGLKMIFPGRGISWADASGEDREAFLGPLPIPMVAGPSLLAARLLLTSGDQVPHDRLGYCIASRVVCDGADFVFLEFVFQTAWHRGLIAVERLMGMIIIMISVQVYCTCRPVATS